MCETEGELLEGAGDILQAASGSLRAAAAKLSVCGRNHLQQEACGFQQKADYEEIASDDK